MEPEPEPLEDQEQEGQPPDAQPAGVAAVMSAAGLTDAAQALSYLRSARGQVELAVARAHHDRRQSEREAERVADGGDDEALDRTESADLPPLRRTVSSFVGRALVWVDCLFAADLMLPPPPPPSGDAARDALGNYCFVTISVDGQAHDTPAVRRSCRPEWHAAFPFVVQRRKPFWVSAVVSGLDGRSLAAGGRLVIAHAQATASFSIDLLATIEGEAGAGVQHGRLGVLHLAARKLRSKPAAEIQSVLQLTTRPRAPEDEGKEATASGGRAAATALAQEEELSAELQEALIQLMGMGFEDVSQCTKALQVADGNVETAIALILSNDIPPTPKPAKEEPQPPAAPPRPVVAEGDRGRADGRQKWQQKGGRWVKVPPARHEPLLQQAGFRPIWHASRGDNEQQIFWWVLLPCDAKEGSVKFQHRRFEAGQDVDEGWSNFGGETVHKPNTRWWHSPPWSRGNSQYEIRCVVDGKVFCDGMREPVQWAAGEPPPAPEGGFLEEYGLGIDEGTMLRRGQSAPVGYDTLAASAVGGGYLDTRWDAPGSYLRHGKSRLKSLQPAPSFVAVEVGNFEVELLVRQRSLSQASKAGKAGEEDAAAASAGAVGRSFMPAVLFESFKCVPCGQAIFDIKDAHRLHGCGHQVCRPCLVDAAMCAAQGSISASRAPCPHQPCESTSWLTPQVARELLTPADYDSWLESCLADFKQSEEEAGTLCRCPECMLTFTTAPKTTKQGPDEAPLLLADVDAVPKPQQKQMLHERLYPLVQTHQPELADKITGILLELDNSILLLVLNSPESLAERISQALTVLEAHGANETEYTTSLLQDQPQLFRGCKPAAKSLAEKKQPERKVMDAMGQMRVLTAAEKAHYESNRYRCPDCATNFCRECDMVPYHVGFTCLGFELAENQRKCRFCQAGLTEHNLAQNPPAESLQDCCTNEDCLKKRDLCCRVVLACDHPCGGLHADGDLHPPCLVCGERNVHPDTSTGRVPVRCPEGHKLKRLSERNTGWACDGDSHDGGCLSGFTDHAGEAEADSSHGAPLFRCDICDYDLCTPCFDRACPPTVAPHIEIPGSTECCFICSEPLSTAPILQTACGHIWHADCLKEIVAEGRAQNEKKLSFDYMKCPLCMQELEHKFLELEGDVALKQACEVAAMEQFDKNRQEGEAEAEKRGMTALQYAMFHFEFAPCKQCRLPFFVRAHDCGADAAAEAGGAAVDPPMPVGDMLCGTCREARGGVVTCSIHGKDSIMWKCRYCCKMATYECFGYFHACDDCHPYEVLQHLMDFSAEVDADAGAKRGGVDPIAFPRVYSNKKDICDYKQCPGPAHCPLGAAHARTGFEHCFGCTQCAAEKLMRELDEVLVEVLRKAPNYLPHGVDLSQMDDLPSRLAHYLWRGGAQLATSGWLTKKQIVHSLQVVLSGDENEPKQLELRIKGDIAAVAKAHSIEQLGAAIEQWAETMADRADLLRRTRIALSVMAPVELTAEAAVAAAATDAASGAEVEFDVKLRAVVSYRELRDVDMQLADPLAPNDPDAEDGDEMIIVDTTPQSWASKLGRLIRAAIGSGEGGISPRNWPMLVDFVPAQIEPDSRLGPGPEPESEPEVKLGTMDTEALQEEPKQLETKDRQQDTPLESVLRRCHSGPVGDVGVLVLRFRWMPPQAEHELEPEPEPEAEAVAAEPEHVD